MRRAEEGFATALAIGIIALLAIAILGFAAIVASQRAEIRAARDALALERAAARLTSRLAYAFATAPSGPRGLVIGADRIAAADLILRGAPGRPARGAYREVAFDSRLYRTRDGYLVRIQDAAGLLDLNGAPEAAIARLLGEAGIDDAERRAAVLADYIDPDAARRAGGAERGDYARAGLPPPRDAPLRSVDGARAALGWNENPSNSSFYSWAFAAQFTLPLNLNTAPAPVLRAALGIDSRAAAYLVDARADRTFLSLEDAIARTGVRADAGELAIGARPARMARLTMRRTADAARGSWGVETWVMLAPDNADRPVVLQPPRRIRLPPWPEYAFDVAEPFPDLLSPAGY